MFDIVQNSCLGAQLRGRFLDLLALFHLDGPSKWNRFVVGTTYRWVMFASQFFEFCNIWIWYFSAISKVWLIRFDKSFVCEWYVVEYSNLVSRRVKISVYKLNKNFLSRFDIIIFEKFQFAISSFFNNAFAQFFVDQIFLSSTIVISLLYLQVIDITLFNSICKSEIVKTKSIVIV